MLEIFTGFMREMMGINRDDRRDAERAQLRWEIERETLRLISNVVRTRHPRRLLAEHWLRLYATQQELDASAGSLGIEHEGRLAMKMLARWVVLAAPVFDEIPILAAGLTRVDELDGAGAWIGTAQEMLLACDGARRRGLRLDVDAGERVTRLYRGATLLATLVEDPAHTTDGARGLAPTDAAVADALVAHLQRGLVAALAAIPDA